MYLLAMPLLWYIAENEEDGSVPYMFALMWPVAALEVIILILLGKNNGTGTD